ncbi:MAG: hypothetical protein EXR82_06670 [Gammaproteobacteria bacterium]|nr:hypothetical protein [Gammaproteobacteria bacterium]
MPVGSAAWLRVPVSFFITILLLSSGGEADAASSNSVVISAPVTRPTYATTIGKVSLAGTASARAGVVQVTWRSDRGGSGVATGTSRWSAPNVRLASGINNIVVTASDRLGRSRQDSVAVTYTPPADTTPPAAPGSLGATATSGTQINLTWGAASDSVGVTGYALERCQGAGCTSFAQIATATATTFSNTALAAGTTYRYRVRARDAANNLSAYSPTATASTPAAADATAPTAPGSLGATATSSTQINLSWGAASDSVGVTGYALEQCQGASCTSFTQIATATSTTFSNTGLAGGTTYRYRVRAWDAANNLGAYSPAATATTPAAADTTAPTAPGNLGATATSSTQINLTWGAASDSVGVTGYALERCQGASCTNFTQITTATGTTFSNTGLTGGTTYRYRVRARDAANNLGAYSPTATAATPAANSPPVISGSSGTTVVAGTAYAFTPTASDPDGQTLTFSVMGAPAWATFNTATGRLNGTPGVGDVGLTEGIVITVSDGTAYASLPAFSLAVTQSASGSALLSWLPPTTREDGSALTNLAGYRIRYGQNAAALTLSVALNSSALTSYLVEGLTAGRWYFSISALDAAGVESDPSNIGSKTIL